MNIVVAGKIRHKGSSRYPKGLFCNVLKALNCKNPFTSIFRMTYKKAVSIASRIQALGETQREALWNFQSTDAAKLGELKYAVGISEILASLFHKDIDHKKQILLI